MSARPLRAPWVEMKYSSTVMPSRKFERTGTSMMRPVGSAIRPRMPPSWPMLPLFPRAPEAVIIVTAPSSGRAAAIISVGDAVVVVSPDLDDLLVALLVGDQAALVLLIDLLDPVVRGLEQPRLRAGSMSSTAIVMPPRVA